MTNNNIFKSQYFNWLCEIAMPDNNLRENYSNLLAVLYEKIYIPRMDMDFNRAQDGINLRYKFASDGDYEETNKLCDYEPCTMLEMMLALAIRMEESIMYDSDKGDRTSVWFNCMLKNMQLDFYSNGTFNYERVELVISLFLEGQYAADGTGSLFITKNRNIDMRDYDLWYQMNFFAEYIDKLESLGQY